MIFWKRKIKDNEMITSEDWVLRTYKSMNKTGKKKDSTIINEIKKNVPIQLGAFTVTFES